MLLGATMVQGLYSRYVHGFRIIEDLLRRFEQLDGRKGFATIDDFIGKSVPSITLIKTWISLSPCYYQPGQMHSLWLVLYCLWRHFTHQSINITQKSAWYYSIKKRECVQDVIFVSCWSTVLLMIGHHHGRTTPQRRWEYLKLEEFHSAELPLNVHWFLSTPVQRSHVLQKAVPI